MQGGLGVRDPEIENKVHTTKKWWIWITNPFHLWDCNWKGNYALNMEHKYLIRLQEISLGSLICNATWKNRHVIQQHAFWEI